MKTKNYLLIILTLLLACKGENQKSANAEVLVSMKQNSKTVIEARDASSVNIKDIFLLLPNDAFPVKEISINNRKLLLDNIGEDIAFDFSQTPIGVCDVKNGYLNLIGLQYEWEMCYWNLKDSGKLVAINNSTETGSEIRVFFYDNGQLTEDFNYILGGKQNYKLTDFIDVSQLPPKSRKYAEQQFADGEYHLYFELPQNGTSIKIGIDIEDLIDEQENYDVFYEATKNVILKWENETWIR